MTVVARLLVVVVALGLGVDVSHGFSNRLVPSLVKANCWRTTNDLPPLAKMSTDPENNGSDRAASMGFVRRFTNPVIDDPWLPLSDVSTAQIVAPALQVFWISLVHAPSPSWLRPIFDKELWQARGALLAPTLIHGAALACCWLAGALAAEAYSRKAIDPTVEGYGAVLGSILKAGAFATGLLVFATQIDLLLEFGRYVQPGESPEIDLRLLSALVEVLNDVIFEASTLASFRLLLAFTTDLNSRR